MTRRRRPAASRRPFRSALALLLSGAAALPLAPPAAARPSGPREAGAEEALGEARWHVRDAGLSSGDPFTAVEARGGLWAARARAARGASALRSLTAGAARDAAEGLDGAALGLPGLADWIRISAGLARRDEKRPTLGRAGEASALLDFAAGPVAPVLARAAVAEASRRARTPEERQRVRVAAARLAPADPLLRPRGALLAALAAARVAEGREALLDALVPLLALLPDAPERAASLLDEADRKLLMDASLGAPPVVRLARARSLAARRPDDAAKLVGRPAGSGPERLAAAEVLLLSGRTREAERELTSLLARDILPAPEAQRAESLLLSARLRTAAWKATARARPAGRTRKGKRRLGAAAPATPRVDPSAAAPLLAELDRLLALPLPDADRRLLLADGVRATARMGILGETRRLLPSLLALDPGTTTGSDALFDDAFGRYRRGEAEAAGRLLSEQATLYRDVATRRRATFWAGCAREAAGDTATARALHASLLPGAVPDVYGQWAARSLGVAVPRALPAPAGSEPGEAPLSPLTPGPASRELLACGFPELAGDAAEEEGRLDPLFAAAVASELGDHRRAVGILKARYPELGTPEEGAAPLAARRAYYPTAHLALLSREAEAREVPVALLLGLVRQESLFQPAVRSRAGAVGLMQVMPATGRLVARREGQRGRPDLHDPEENVRLGTRFFADLLRQFDGDAPAALAAYNAGPGRVVRWRRERPGLGEAEFVETIPLAETRDYVKRVLFYQGAYEALLSHPAGPAPLTAAF